MTPDATTVPLPDKVIAIHEALDAARIPHALGGALALAYYAEPRVDDRHRPQPLRLGRALGEVLDALTPLGVDAGDLDEAALLRDGQCRLWWGSNPVDLFFAYDEIHEEMRKDARRVPFAETTVPILAPEHLAVCKAMFDRPKDWLDIEQMLVATEELDVAAIEGWLERMVGRDNQRLQHLAELKATLAIERPSAKRRPRPRRRRRPSRRSRPGRPGSRRRRRGAWRAARASPRR